MLTNTLCMADLTSIANPNCVRLEPTRQIYYSRDQVYWMPLFFNDNFITVKGHYF